MPALGRVEDSIRDDFSRRRARFGVGARIAAAQPSSRADAMLMPCEFATSYFELGAALGLYGR
jgi:hypothetical protein